MLEVKPYLHVWPKLATFSFDVFASGAAFLVALAVVSPELMSCSPVGCDIAFAYTSIFIVVAALAIVSQRLYRGIWRYTSFSDCVAIARTTGLCLLIFVPVVFVATGAEALPRSALLVAGFGMMFFMGAPRVFARALANHSVPLPFTARRINTSQDAVPVLLVGKAERAEMYLRSLQRLNGAPYAAVGVLTEESSWHGRAMHGIGVLGAPKDIGHALAFLKQRQVVPHRLVIVDDQIDKAGISAYLELAVQHGLALGRAPRVTDIRGAADSMHAIVEPVEIADLLDRPQLFLDCSGLRQLVENKSILVSGAGGSIGSELVRQLSDLNPAKIVLVENCEFNLYSIDLELGTRHPPLERVPVICDVRNGPMLNKVFADHRPEIVFHAAALKHVPMVEFNPIEGIRTNALGTKNMADACVKYGVRAMVLISTDKAVNPCNVMGASKRCAEAYCQALDAQGGPTRFVAVRFGNVLGSTGSVVPLFQRQLAAGGPITVTDPVIERYFMTIPEAVRLVLQASVLGASGTMPRGRVYVLDMGSPVKIVDLARRMIRLAGKEPDKDIKIVFTGLRPGEKLYEEIAHIQEELSDTPVHGVMMVSPRTSDLPIIQHQFSAIADAANALDRGKVLSLLSTIVPEYKRSPEEVEPQPALAKNVVGMPMRNSTNVRRTDDEMHDAVIPVPMIGADVLHGRYRNPETGPYSGV